MKCIKCGAVITRMSTHDSDFIKLESISSSSWWQNVKCYSHGACVDCIDSVTDADIRYARGVRIKSLGTFGAFPTNDRELYEKHYRNMQLFFKSVIERRLEKPEKIITFHCPGIRYNSKEGVTRDSTFWKYNTENWVGLSEFERELSTEMLYRRKQSWNLPDTELPLETAYSVLLEDCFKNNA